MDEKPLFLFNVTMQNHGGYAVESVAGDVEPIEIEPAYSGYSDAVCFMTLMRESDQAFSDFLSDLEAREEPIVVCMFGDHQPALDTELRNAITVQDGGNEVAQKQKSQMTPYMIWTSTRLCSIMRFFIRNDRNKNWPDILTKMFEGVCLTRFSSWILLFYFQDGIFHKNSASVCRENWQ